MRVLPGRSRMGGQPMGTFYWHAQNQEAMSAVIRRFSRAKEDKSLRYEEDPLGRHAEATR